MSSISLFTSAVVTATRNAPLMIQYISFRLSKYIEQWPYVQHVVERRKNTEVEVENKKQRETSKSDDIVDVLNDVTDTL